MDLFIDWMTVERFLEWKEGIKKLQETTGKITDEDLIETYQDEAASQENKKMFKVTCSKIL